MTLRATRLFALRQPYPSRRQDEKPRARRPCRLAPRFWDTKSLKSRIGDAILKPFSVRIVLTQPSRRRVFQPCMKSSSPGLALRSLPALEVIGSDSDLVARSDLGLRLA